jgi:intermembrane space import and assembly protein 40
VLLAGGAVYFYCTSPYFEPRSDRYGRRTELSSPLGANSITAFRPEPLIPPPVVEDAPTLESLAAERKARKAKEEEQLAALAAKPQSEDGSPADPAKAEGELEEKSQAGAFNPETGEINWDCPCLGGMADGPCGENFKAAFSCFVFSQEEPKGMDCIDKFK